MGWGKGKGKALERALHQAERQEEWAAERALARGDIASAIAHAQKAETLENAEHAIHWKGKAKGKGKGHRSAEVVVVPASEVKQEVVVVNASPVQPPVAVVTASVQPEVLVLPRGKGYKGAGKAAERALHREEQFQEAAVGVALARGDAIGAAIHAEKAATLQAAEQAVHKEVVHARMHQAHSEEKRQHNLAVRDLAHGNILGAIAHEARAENAHHREQRLERELSRDHRHHHHHKGNGKGWW